MRKAIVLFLALTCCSILSSAQQPKPAALDKLDIFGGYSYSRVYFVNEPPFPDPMSLNGGQASVTYYFMRHVGATAEFAAYTDDLSTIQGTFNTQGYLFGPSTRFGLGKGRNQRVSFFAHQLFGTTHISLKPDQSGEQCTETSAACTTNSFTMVTGGGVDFKLKKHISIRPVQMEYFTQQIALYSFLGEGGATGVRAAATSSAEVGDPNSIKLSTNGFRYSGGVVVRF